MSKDFFTKKVRIVCATLFFIAFTINVFSEYPFDLPKESELNYTSGIFNIIRGGESTNHVLLNQMDNIKGSRVFSCSYSPIRNGKGSSCADKKYLEPFTNKWVKIGWYETDEFFGFRNDKAQLVTIEMNGKMVRDYEYTVGNVNSAQHGSFTVLLPLSFFMSIFVYWFLGLGHE